MKTGPIIAVIPARFASTRFPGKPLTPILGKPLIQWVWEGARQAGAIDRVIVATDDDRIASVASGFGAEVRKTRKDHPSGTDRIAEATAGMEAGWILNIQGDEPLIEGSFLDAWIGKFQPNFVMTTVATPLSDPADLPKPDIVKVSWDSEGRALGFRRQVFPAQAQGWTHQHVGLYAYTPQTLRTFISLPPSPGREKRETGAASGSGERDCDPSHTAYLPIRRCGHAGDVPRAERALANRATSVSK